MTISNTPALPVTTQPLPPLFLRYTLDYERIKQDRCKCFCATIVCGGFGGGLGGFFAELGVTAITNPIAGIFIGAPISCCVGCGFVALVSGNKCKYIKHRDVTAYTELPRRLVAVVSGQQKSQELPPSLISPCILPVPCNSQELPSAPPPLYQETGHGHAATVHSQPKVRFQATMHSSSLSPGVDSSSTIHPTTHATSEIMSGISDGSYSKVASGSYS